MLEENFLRHLIEDILLAGEYTIAEIAKQVETTEDVIFDIVTEKNACPSFHVTRKIIALHQTVRPQLYQGFMQKVVAEYYAMQQNI